MTSGGSKTIMAQGFEPDEQPRKRSRAASPSEKKPRQNLTIRIRTELREKLEERAKLNGRSLSEEVEMFLELGFAEQDRQDELWAADWRRHFEKDIQEMFEARQLDILDKLHERNMSETRKLFVHMLDKMRDIQNVFENEKSMREEIGKRISAKTGAE